MSEHRYLEVLKERVLVFDGAMGTSLQAFNLSPQDFGGPGLEGCNDHLVISRPDAVEAVHASFLEVGCDVIETNTFRANRLTMREYGLQDRIVELNREAAALARRVADRFSTAEHPRFARNIDNAPVVGVFHPVGRGPRFTRERQARTCQQ